MLGYLCASVCINTQTYVCICKHRHTKNLPKCGFVDFLFSSIKKFINSLWDLWALSFRQGRVFQAFAQCKGTVLCRSRISDETSLGHLVCYICSLNVASASSWRQIKSPVSKLKQNLLLYSIPGFLCKGDFIPDLHVFSVTAYTDDSNRRLNPFHTILVNLCLVFSFQMLCFHMSKGLQW